MNPLLYVKSDERVTLALGLRVLQQMDPTNWPLMMAGAVVMMLPVLLLMVARAARVLARGRAPDRARCSLGDGPRARARRRGAADARRAVAEPPACAARRSRSWCSATRRRRRRTSGSSPTSARRHPDDAGRRLVHIAGQGDYRKRLGVDFAAGTPADVILLNYRRYGAFAAKGVLEPLGPWLARSRVIKEQDFYAAGVEPFRWHGTLTCIPQNLSSLVVYYNKDLFDARRAPAPRATTGRGTTSCTRRGR